MYLEYYKNGKKEGMFTYFDEQGSPIKHEYYKNDSLINAELLNSR
jgi:antitoxin component YwqK of YwqJK toxin-antitoxin module